MSDALDADARDAMVAAARATASIVPGIGGVLGEGISRAIAGQRMDRVALFVRKLAERVDSIEALVKESPHFADLFEDGVLQAARALSERRNEAIAVFLAGCSQVDLQSHEMKKKLLLILGELTDQDIEVLGSYLGHEHMRLWQRFGREAVSIGAYERMSPQQRYAYDADMAMLDAHHRILERLGLLEQEFEVRLDASGRMRIPELDADGRQKSKGFGLTRLGRLLLGSIATAPAGE